MGETYAILPIIAQVIDSKQDRISRLADSTEICINSIVKKLAKYKSVKIQAL